VVDINTSRKGETLPESHEIQVLVVDDDLALCELLRTTFELEGIKVHEAHHVIEAERLLADSRPDAIVLDIGLPGVDGAFYCERLRESPQTQSIPIIAISGSQEAGVRALTAGANAFAGKPFDPISLLSTLERLVGVSPLEHAMHSDNSADGAGELRRLIQIGQRQHDLLQHSYRQTLEALVDALETRDFGTSAHSHRVSAYATRLTLEVRPSLVDDPTLEWGFLLHDVGKIGVPDEILLKPGPLDASERARIEQHTLLGERLVQHIPLLQGAGLRVIRSHHERWDGGGYPDHFSDDSIPAEARIFAVADALDAMTGERPYRKSISWDEAIEEVTRGRGTQFDPDVVDSLISCEPDLHTVYTEAQPT
jgi:response regulator RpfG family c-di-GMP phosphodiesterase